MPAEFTPVTVTHEMVPTWQQPEIDEKLVKVNKRLAKMGAPAATVAYGPVVETSDVDDCGRRRTYRNFATVTVTGVTAKLAGWTPVATLDHTFVADEALVSRFPGQIETVIPDRFRYTGSACDHCGIRIARNMTILFVHDDGRWTQVGTTCVMEYIGIDPSVVLWLAGAFGLVTLDDDGSPLNRGYVGPVPGEYLAMAAEVVRRFGFQPTSEISNTRDAVAFFLNAKADTIRKEFPELNLDRGAADAALIAEWVLAQPASSEFMQSAHIAVRSDKVGSKTEGLLACLPHIYGKAMLKAEAAAAEQAAGKASDFVGTVGKKVIVTGTVVVIRDFDGDYGVRRMIVVRTEAGDRLSTVGAGMTLFASGIHEGATVEWAGKVVAHSDGNYGRETKCKLVKVAIREAVAA